MSNTIEFPEIKKGQYRCAICRIRPAKWLCDYENGLLFDAPSESGHKLQIQKGYCSATLCDKCTTKINGKDYCPKHVLDLKWEFEQKTKNNTSRKRR